MFTSNVFEEMFKNIPEYIEVKVEGLNGQLPNLDLVNLAHKLCVLSDIHHSYQNSFTWLRSRNKIDEWVYSIWTMLKMSATQITGVPNGNHGLFLPFGIDAITLEGRGLNDPAGDPPRAQYLNTRNFYLLGITLERILRSLNNLLERFHQSFFFYMLAATNRYISIGQYMPSLCVLCGVMLTRALCLWVSLQQDEDIDKQDEKDNKVLKEETKERNEENVDTKVDKDSEEKEHLIKDVTETNEDVKNAKEDLIKSKEDVKNTKEDEIKTKEDEIKAKEGEIKGTEEVIKTKKDVGVNINLFNVGSNYLTSHALGYIAFCAPDYFNYIGTGYDKTPETSIFYGFIAFSVFVIFVTLFPPMTFEEMLITNILLLIELATACLSIGMHNFPLGLFIAVLYTPLALLVGVVGNDRGKRSGIFLFFKRILCILLHPLFVVCFAMILYSWFLFSEEGILSVISKGKDAAMQGIMFSVVDSVIYRNWLFRVVTMVIFPAWILFWQICNGN